MTTTRRGRGKEIIKRNRAISPSRKKISSLNFFDTETGDTTTMTGKDTGVGGKREGKGSFSLDGLFEGGGRT